jgi:predicted Zn-dependent protease
MASKKLSPQAPDLSALIEGLCEAGIEYIIVGGLAAVAQGAPVTTFDLDIVHRQTEENIRKLLTFLKSISARLRRPDDKIIEPRDRQRLPIYEETLKLTRDKRRT